LGQAGAGGLGGAAVVAELLLGQLPEQRADAGVGVLDVVDRVLVAAALGQVQVEIQVLVVAAHHVEEAGGVGADFLAQLAQGDEAAGAGGHLHALAAAEQDGELHQLHLDLRRIQTQALGRGLEPGDVAVVVGAEDVDGALAAAPDLAPPAAAAARDTGGAAVVAPVRAVLAAAGAGGADAPRAGPLAPVALLLQRGDGTLDVALGHQRALGEEVVVVHAEAGEVVADVLQAPGQAGLEHLPVGGLAEQLAGAGNQRVDVRFLVAALRLVRRQAVGDLDGAAAQAVAGAVAQV